MHSFAWWPMLAVLITATFTDLRSRRIPNWLVVPTLLSGFVANGWIQGWHGVEVSLAGMLVGGGIFAILFLLGGMGAGDVKLCAALGAWIGPAQMLTALVTTGLAGGVMLLVWALCAGFVRDLFRSTSAMVIGNGNATMEAPAEPIVRRTMPYGPAIAVGTLLSFFAH